MKTAAQIAAEVSDLAERARTNRLTREEITGGTFTVSNLGMFGVDRGDGDELLTRFTPGLLQR